MRLSSEETVAQKNGSETDGDIIVIDLDQEM